MLAFPDVRSLYHGGKKILTGCITSVFVLPCPGAFRSGVERQEKTFFCLDLFMRCCYSTSAAVLPGLPGKPTVTIHVTLR